MLQPSDTIRQGHHCRAEGGSEQRKGLGEREDTSIRLSGPAFPRAETQAIARRTQLAAHGAHTV